MLTQRSKYALRAMLMLAGQPTEKLLLVSEISTARKVPRKFLEQILLALKQHGLLESQRGKSGGYRLARTADRITFGEIIRITDGPLAMIACASLTGYRACDDCEDEKTCAIRKTLRSVRDATAAILDTVTLAEALKLERKPRAKGRGEKNSLKI
jgi:Rrf2 family protein